MNLPWIVVLAISHLFISTISFQSDELLFDDEEFGLEGSRSIDPLSVNPSFSHIHSSSSVNRNRHSDLELESKIQFPLDHALGDSDFVPAGTFSARLKISHAGGKVVFSSKQLLMENKKHFPYKTVHETLTKLRFSRITFSEEERDTFKKLLENDDFYRIRVPNNVLSLSGRDYVISSVKARCLPREILDEHFTIHMEGVNIVAVNYGSPGPCQYPRQLKFPAKWSFNSHTILKNSEQAPRTPTFAEEVLIREDGDGEGVKISERSFWAKYWMYLIPLGLIVMNAMTQAMNMPEEAAGQSSSQTQQPIAAIKRGQTSTVRRR